MYFIKSSKVLPASQQVKRIGQYLYKHIDGAFKQRSGSNEFDVYFLLLYQLKPLLREPNSDYPVGQMNININVTTYQNKIRINIIEVSPEERTLGCDVYSPEKVEDLNKAFPIIMQKVYRRICKAYEDYEFIY